MEQNNNGKTLEHRLTTLEVNVESILKNHLPHLHKKANWSIGIGVTILIAIVISSIMERLNI